MKFTEPPLRGSLVLTSPFGNRKHPTLGTTKFHEGVDYDAAVGTPVLAVGDGTVIWVSNDDVCGNGIGLELDGGHYRVTYCHLSERSVRKGERVAAGEQIGRSGSTGRVSGPHLHFAVKEKTAGGDWVFVDPVPLVPSEDDTPSDRGIGDAIFDWWSWWWSEDEEEATGDRRQATEATFAARGLTARLVELDGTVYEPGVVKPGRYRLEVSMSGIWQPLPQPVDVKGGHRYTVYEEGGRVLLSVI